MSVFFRLSCLRINYTIFMCSTLILFLTNTVLLFLHLNRIQPHYFIDEAFHIPQTLQYCAWKFTQWDPKITTLPGLYLITAAALSPFNLCNITYIRAVNLIGTCVNLYLVYNIIKEKCKSNEMVRWNNWMVLALAYNITLFPPLYFWCFFYYTDVISVNMVLLMFLLYQRRCTKMTALVGVIAILIRQTNIVWLSFFSIENALDIFDYRRQQSVPPRLLNTPLHFHLIWKQIRFELYKGTVSFIKFIRQICHNLFPYIIVCLVFVTFVVWNGGIVIGDRTAHIATIHICQIFYFSMFVSLFSWPYTISKLRVCWQFFREYWVYSNCIVVLMIAIIYFNTLVHPYVLADNRHYWFYLWNRFIGRYTAFKYLLIPIYYVSLFAIWQNISHLRFLTQINYIFCLCIVLIPQLLVEPRYFILPYIFYRLHMKRPHKWQICLESFTTLAINIFQFLIFTNKVFYWKDQPYAQRISW